MKRKKDFSKKGLFENGSNPSASLLKLQAFEAPTDYDIQQIAEMPIEEIKAGLAKMGILEIPVPAFSSVRSENRNELANLFRFVANRLLGACGWVGGKQIQAFSFGIGKFVKRSLLSFSVAAAVLTVGFFLVFTGRTPDRQVMKVDSSGSVPGSASASVNRNPIIESLKPAANSGKPAEVSGPAGPGPTGSDNIQDPNRQEKVPFFVTSNKSDPLIETYNDKNGEVDPILEALKKDWEQSPFKSGPGGSFFGLEYSLITPIREVEVVSSPGGDPKSKFVRDGFGLFQDRTRNREAVVPFQSPLSSEHTFKYGFEFYRNAYDINQISTGPGGLFANPAPVLSANGSNPSVCTTRGSVITCATATANGLNFTSNLIRAAGPTVGTGGPLGGPAGLFTVYDGQSFIKGDHTFIATSNYYDRDPHDADIQGMYIQDDWKVPNNDLQFNIGARWDYRQTDGNEGGTYLKLNNWFDNLQPRIGFIWDFTGKGKGKIFANYARFLETAIPLDINVGAGSADTELLNDALNPFGTVTTDDGNLFTQSTYGGNVFATAPLSDLFFKKRRFTQFSRVGLTYQISATNPPNNVDPLLAVPVIYDQPNILTSRVTASFVYDSRQLAANGIDTARGSQLALSFGFAGLGGDVRTYSPGLGFSYMPVRKKTSYYPEVFGFRILSATVGSYAIADTVRNANSISFVGGVPIYERYYLGSENDIRGFASRSIGPIEPFEIYVKTRYQNGASIRPSGDMQLSGSFEYRIPIFGRASDRRKPGPPRTMSDFLTDSPFYGRPAKKGYDIEVRTPPPWEKIQDTDARDKKEKPKPPLGIKIYLENKTLRSMLTGQSNVSVPPRPDEPSFGVSIRFGNRRTQ